MPRVRRTGELVRHPVVMVALVAALLRVPFLHAPMSPDEGGFLIVGQHWQSGGGSLYGPYWVDRPPLLIAFFRLADSLGGFEALRLLGCVVVALTVIGVGFAGSFLAATPRASDRAALWSSLAAAALLVTPTGGSLMVNGELIAAPFIAFGLAFSMHALRGGARADASAIAAGVCATAAVMVKQNMADVAVFALVLGIAAVVRRRVPLVDVVRRLVLSAAGVVVSLVVVAVASMLRGTSPWGVLYAMYPFRLRAAALMQQTNPHDRVAHLSKMLEMWGVTGAPLLIAGFVAYLLLRRRPPSVPYGGAITLALLALVAYDVASILAGGSYWSHYVIQLVVPTALMAGLLATQVRRVGPLVVAAVMALSGLGWVLGLTARVSSDGPTIGAAIAATAQPGDSMLSLLGDGAMVRTSGLPAPYPYLWSLPAHVLDPHFRKLTAVLRSNAAPSWVVVRGPTTMGLLEREGPGRVLHERYRLVTTLCQHPVYLRRDLSRRAPETDNGTCTAPIAPWTGDHATHRWTVTDGAPRWDLLSLRAR
jgi:hypothetical protein